MKTQVPKDIPGTRLECLTRIFWLKRTVRNRCQAIEDYHRRAAKLRTLRRKLQKEKEYFFHYRISMIDELLADIEAWSGYIRADLVKAGEQVQNILQVADKLLSFHDKCQALSRDHLSIAKQMERKNIAKNTKLIDLVTTFNLETDNKSKLSPYSPKNPLYVACCVHLTYQMIHSISLDRQSTPLFNELFPGLPWEELQVDSKKQNMLYHLPANSWQLPPKKAVAATL